MTLKQELREVLNKVQTLVSGIETSWFEMSVDQALTQILTKFKERLPKDKSGEDICHKVPYLFCGSCNKIKGYNQYRTDTLKMIEEECLY